MFYLQSYTFLEVAEPQGPTLSQGGSETEAGSTDCAVRRTCHAWLALCWRGATAGPLSVRRALLQRGSPMTQAHALELRATLPLGGDTCRRCLVSAPGGAALTAVPWALSPSARLFFYSLTASVFWRRGHGWKFLVFIYLGQLFGYFSYFPIWFSPCQAGHPLPFISSLRPRPPRWRSPLSRWPCSLGTAFPALWSGRHRATL